MEGKTDVFSNLKQAFEQAVEYSIKSGTPLYLAEDEIRRPELFRAVVDEVSRRSEENYKEKNDVLEELAAPIVEWIREHHGHHTEVHISWDHVWVRQDSLSLPFPYLEK